MDESTFYVLVTGANRLVDNRLSPISLHFNHFTFIHIDVCALSMQKSLSYALYLLHTCWWAIFFLAENSSRHYINIKGVILLQ